MHSHTDVLTRRKTSKPLHTPYSGKTSAEFGLTKKRLKSFTKIGSEREYCKTSNIFLTWIAQSCSSKIYYIFVDMQQII